MEVEHKPLQARVRPEPFQASDDEEKITFFRELIRQLTEIRDGQAVPDGEKVAQLREAITLASRILVNHYEKEAGNRTELASAKRKRGSPTTVRNDAGVGLFQLFDRMVQLILSGKAAFIICRQGQDKTTGEKGPLLGRVLLSALLKIRASDGILSDTTRYLNSSSTAIYRYLISHLNHSSKCRAVKEILRETRALFGQASGRSLETTLFIETALKPTCSPRDPILMEWIKSILLLPYPSSKPAIAGSPLRLRSISALQHTWLTDEEPANKATGSNSDLINVTAVKDIILSQRMSTLKNATSDGRKAQQLLSRPAKSTSRSTLCSICTGKKISEMRDSKMTSDGETLVQRLHRTLLTGNAPLPQKCQALAQLREILDSRITSSAYDTICCMIRAAIVDKSRHVRQSANILVPRLIVQARADHGDIAINHWLKTTVQSLLKSSSQIHRNTAISILYQILLHGETDLDRYALCQLIFCSPGWTCLRAAASQYLLQITQVRKCTFYRLVQPHLKVISINLALRVCRSPEILDEFCDLMAQSTESFLSQNLQFVLPALIIQSKDQEIRRISHLMQSDTASLCYENIVNIFASILIGKNPDQGLACFSRVISDDKATMSKSALIATCGMSLVINIALELGTLNKQRRRRVVLALKGLAYESSNIGSSKDGPTVNEFQAISKCLRSHALGILSGASDVIQESKTRQLTVDKEKALRALQLTIGYIGPSFRTFAAQLTAILQTTLAVPELAHQTLRTWRAYVMNLAFKDLEPCLPSCLASIWLYWSRFQKTDKALAIQILHYIISDHGSNFVEQLKCWRWLPEDPVLKDIQNKLDILVDKADNLSVIRHAIPVMLSGDYTTRSYMLCHVKDLIFSNLGHTSDTEMESQPILKVMIQYLVKNETEDENNIETCVAILGRLGAIDSDRIKFDLQPETFIVHHGYCDAAEVQNFATFLIDRLLVDAYKATGDGSIQALMAYAIQELLKIAAFGPWLLSNDSTDHKNQSADLRAETTARWNSLSQSTTEVAMPFLESRYSVPILSHSSPQFPIYKLVHTYRRWLGLFSIAMIAMLSDFTPKAIFEPFLHILKRADTARFAEFLLPHLFLQIMVHGKEADRNQILREVKLILGDTQSKGPSDRKSVAYHHQCSQQIFLLFDHYNAWKRKDLIRRDEHAQLQRTSASLQSIRQPSAAEDIVADSISLPQIAEAAMNSGSSARALLLYEKLLCEQPQHSSKSDLSVLQKMQVLYFNMDEPDGLEGLTAHFVAPSIEQQILAHEAARRWSSAQTCYEVSLQSQPANINNHVGMLTCLKNLGHWESVLTRSEAAVASEPEWAARLAPFLIESAYMINDWSRMKDLLAKSSDTTFDLLIARLLFALKNNDDKNWTTSLREARLLVAQGFARSLSYRAAYEAMIQAHILRDVEAIKQGRHIEVEALLARTSAADPAHSVHERLTNMIRAAVQAHHGLTEREKTNALGKIYLFSSRVARKAGLYQIAYAKLLQVPRRESGWILEYAKWLYGDGQTQRGMTELRSLISPHLEKSPEAKLNDDDNVDLSVTKAALLYARWIEQTGHAEHLAIRKAYDLAVHLRPCHESVHYHLGSYYYKLLQNSGAQHARKRFAFDRLPNALETGFIYNTCKYFTNSAIYGHKYIYQTLPRVLSLWLDLGARPEVISGQNAHLRDNEDLIQAVKKFEKINGYFIPRLLKELPSDRWMTAWPQLISRIGHQNEIAWRTLQKCIVELLCKYPQQGIWALIAVSRSKHKLRFDRASAIFAQAKASRSSPPGLRKLVDEAKLLASALLRLCSIEIKDRQTQLSLSRSCEVLSRLGPLDLMIPLQDSMTVELSGKRSAAPFRAKSVAIRSFHDHVQIMQSLAKPRKLTIYGADGRAYAFLAKPKDDLRKDMRMMELSSLINMLLERNSSAARRSLRIRTYAVVPLDEESGLLQWVSDTKGFRQIVSTLYKAMNKPILNAEIKALLEVSSKSELQRNFVNKVLPAYPPVFHQYFVDSFPQPAHWLQARTNYTRTVAVMSVVGFILGLGDRHGENILLDEITGDCVHVDFDCLFEKGQTLKIAEQVPFRLTQNIVDGMGVMKHEGFFRKAAEVTLQAVKRNSESLLSVLETFVHDPLVEWTSPRRKDEIRISPHSDFNEQATMHLQVVQRKLNGFVPTIAGKEEGDMLPFSVEGQVEEIIKRATDPSNLSRMYIGWMAWL